MKKIFFLSNILILFNCNSQNNPKITYKDYSYEFQANEYPKSIIELYKEEEKLHNLSDREITIKINTEDIIEDLIDNLLRYNFLENKKNLNESHFNSIKSKLKKYFNENKNDFFNDKMIIDKSQQWIADSIVQNKYGGRIYYDSLKKTPKPKEAYKKMVLDLIDKNEIQISDDFLKKEITNLLKNYLKKEEEIECDFNKIESWNAKK